VVDVADDLVEVVTMGVLLHRHPGHLVEFPRRAAPRTGPAHRVLAGADVLLVGLFSAKDKELGTKSDLLATAVQAHGARVVGRYVQRRGVSRGSAHKMTAPFSRRTLLSPGKAREVADACRATQVGAVVFVNPLTPHQRTVLGEIFGCTVLSGEDLALPGG
jgi:50S ribosomal subunit-associated GTPase HflX